MMTFSFPTAPVEPLSRAEKRLVRRFLGDDVLVQQHLGWQHALSWLGAQPFLGYFEHGELQGMLACPPDEDGITWLRLFSCREEPRILSIWQPLWSAADAWLGKYTRVEAVNALLIKDWLQHPLESSGFQPGTRVVVLSAEISRSLPDRNHSPVEIRRMRGDDFQRVYEIDRAAFDRIWRHSLSQLHRAHRAAASATVAELEGMIVGYQISTASTQGGHLARLAVDPAYQQRGIGSALVVDVLKRFQRQGVIEVTVNTQEDNPASLALYRRLGFQRGKETYPVYQYRLNR